MACKGEAQWGFCKQHFHKTIFAFREVLWSKKHCLPDPPLARRIQMLIEHQMTRLHDSYIEKLCNHIVWSFSSKLFCAVVERAYSLSRVFVFLLARKSVVIEPCIVCYHISLNIFHTPLCLWIWFGNMNLNWFACVWMGMSVSGSVRACATWLYSRWNRCLVFMCGEDL